MSNYKYLLFDLDNTLVDDNLNRKYSISKVLDYIGYSYDSDVLDRYVECDNLYWKKMARGEFNYMRPKNMSREETFIWAGGNRIKFFLNELSFDECVDLNNLYMKVMGEQVFPIESVLEVLSELKDYGYLLYIITNGPHDAAIKKRDAISNSLFTDMISSEKVGYMKPKKEYFAAMYDKFGIYDKSDMLIIGDDLDKDVLGGQKEGIDTVWYNRFNGDNDMGVIPTYEINKIDELSKMLIKK